MVSLTTQGLQYATMVAAIDKVLYPLHVRHGRFRGTELPPALIQRCLRLLELLLLISQGLANLMQLALCAQVFCLDRLYLLHLTRQGLGIRLRLRLHMRLRLRPRPRPHRSGYT